MEKKQDNSKAITIIVTIIIAISAIVSGFSNSGTSTKKSYNSKSSSSSSRPWEDLGVSEKEYRDVYKRIQDHGTRNY